MAAVKLRWDDDYERCAGCGTRGQDRPHVAEGLCVECFPARYGDFGLGDVPPAWAAPDAAPPAAPFAAAGRWCADWDACLLCGGTSVRHVAHGVCRACYERTKNYRARGTGLTLIWLPFAGDDQARYDPARARRWVHVRDLDEALRYLAARAAAGQWPIGGKAVIRPTPRAAALPEMVIRPVAA